MKQKKRKANYTWNDEEKHVRLRVEVEDLDKRKVDVYFTPEGYFSLTAEPDSDYQKQIPNVVNLVLNLHDLIVPKESSWKKGEDFVEVSIKKGAPGRWKQLEVEASKKILEENVFHLHFPTIFTPNFLTCLKRMKEQHSKAG